ncbi:TPM domain-containing protein [Tenacibaculum mesophilum]|uniref:TPM domain-containing protein n=1 Tax=Tenacibaculum mesophilum TaxID=104268 RepID=UPI002492F054|nr:TPM domain-containing protein [Tenacibaculum mesophilum]
MKINRLFFVLIVFVSSCKLESSKKVNFSDEINRYNYLDKPHELKFIYDFENIFSEAQSQNLYNKVLDIYSKDSLVFIFISDKKPLRRSFGESTIIINDIFKEKYDLDKIITLKMSKKTREVALAYSESLSPKINDSICLLVIKNVIKPNFKKNKYFDGINNSIDSIIKHTK